MAIFGSAWHYSNSLQASLVFAVAARTPSVFIMECPLYEAQREALRDFVPASERKWPEVAKIFVLIPETSAFVDFCGEAHWLKDFE